jgi:hypothetical protein
METLAVIRQACREESMSHTQVFGWMVTETKKFALMSRGLFTKNSFWQTKHSLPHIL